MDITFLKIVRSSSSDERYVDSGISSVDGFYSLFYDKKLNKYVWI